MLVQYKLPACLRLPTLPLRQFKNQIGEENWRLYIPTEKEFRHELVKFGGPFRFHISLFNYRKYKNESSI
jgi:hypothetical protein